VCEIDFRPGGALRIVMRAPDGTDYPMGGIFREIVTPEEKVKAARLAMLTSRANTMLSIPMLFCMVAQQNGGL
jgi:hypothetical protein